MIYRYSSTKRFLAIVCFMLLGILPIFAQYSVPSTLVASFERPGFITSAGQTSDAAIVKVLANTRLKLGLDYDIAAKPETIANAKTLVLVLGVSNKGLGAAGLSIEQEIERVQSIVAEALKNNTRIISIHTGGTARRGEASNQVIELCVPASDVVIVVEGGNNDGFFASLCEENNVFLVQVPSIAEAGNVLKSLFEAQ
ncbi:MAG TPA: DUF6305 family protein [Rectinema sp.]|nr:DUF6305 family protein [Rectinema sp.]